MMRKVLTYAMLFLILCTVFCSCSNDEKISDATEADNNILESELLLKISAFNDSAINPNRSLEKAFCHFLMTAIRKTTLYMLDS